jgi:GT2 family glycosyltransferase
MQAKKIFSVVVTYNGSKWIQKCLHSLFESTTPTRVIVVDNASTDNTVGIIRQEFPSVELLESSINLGFGKANNRGIKRAMDQKAELIFLLNQDAWIETNTLGTLVGVLEKYSFIGIASPVHFNGSGAALDQHFYSYLLKSDISDFIQTRFTGSELKTEWINTRFVNAAAWLITRSCIEKVGGFDPFFFHYGEDRNYAHRAVYRGFRIVIVPDAKVYHDREQRILQGTKTISERIQHDFMNLKVDAANIRRRNINWFVFKRAIRFGASGLINLVLFNFGAVRYNFSLLFFLLLAYPGIIACRRRGRAGAFVI